MIRLGLQSVTAGANPISINKGINKTRIYLTEKLEELTKPISGPADIKAVASISAGNNDEIGEMIADAIEKVGADGVLSIENGSGLDTVVEVEEGMGGLRLTAATSPPSLLPTTRSSPSSLTTRASLSPTRKSSR